MLISALLFHVLVATATLAVSTSGNEDASLVAGTDVSQPVQVVHPSASAGTTISEPVPDASSFNWAGSILTVDAATNVSSVTGTFTVPTPSIPPGGNSSGIYLSSAWVGIDGYTCETALLRTGVLFALVDGFVTSSAFYEWYPNVREYFGDISVAPGDEVTASVYALTSTSGEASIVNHSTGERTSVRLGGPDFVPLCRKNLDWIVGDPSQPNGPGIPSPLPDFGTVHFSDATGYVFGNPNAGQTVLNIVRNGTTFTTVSLGYETVVVEYIRE
ncbi:hypothetical protein ONZ51_g4823 [Trametes cubensis]|uniref:Uncharacterized protein n=1 Tax=Trametes cubensis TaxID=1111947 RepID=A0AAD7XBN9_9APHY|nr:hypothetical protein ONZ51_g4823 [Trametes cubensis]